MTLQADLRDQLAVNDWNSVAATLAAASATGVTDAINILTRLVQTPTPSGAARSFNTAFQIDATYPTLVFYTVQLSVQAPLLSTQSITVKLLHDQSNPPTTQDGQLFLSSEQLAGLGVVSIATTQQQLLVAWINGGHYAEITTAGTGSASLISTTELVFSG